MTTLAYLRGLPAPSFGVGFDRSEILADAAAAITLAVPTWDVDDNDPTARALKAIVETIWTYGEINQSQALRTLAAFAVGDDLSQLAASDGVARRAGEVDEALRRRWVESPVQLSVGTEARIVGNAFDALEDVADAQAVVRTNRQDVDLYCLKDDLATLETAEWTTVTDYANRRDEVIMGVTVHRADPTVTTYTIALAITYHSSRTDQASLQGSIEADLERYIAGVRRLGRPVTNAGIIAAVLHDTETTPDIVPTTTPNSLPAVAGTVYDGSVGAFTFTRLTP